MDVGENALTKENDEPAAPHHNFLSAPTGRLLPQMYSNCLQLTAPPVLNADQVLQLQPHSQVRFRQLPGGS